MRRCTTNTFLAAALAVVLATPATFAGLTDYQNAVRAPGLPLISYYTFDADTTGVTDTATGGHNGTLQGTAALTADGGGFGNAGKALSLDGSGWANFGQVAAFVFGGHELATATAGTVEMWIRPGATMSTSSYDQLALASVSADWSDPYNPNPDTRWTFQIEKLGDGCGLFAGVGGYPKCAWSFVPDQWYHVAFVVTPDYTNEAPNYYYPTTRVFVNGVWTGNLFEWRLLGEATNAPFQIGAATPTGRKQFIGLIDEVAIYSDRLSGTVIAEHYAKGAMAAPTAATPVRTAYAAEVMADNPIGYYSFENDTTAVADDSGNGHGGTLTPPTYWTSGFAGGKALALDNSGQSGGLVSMGAVDAFKLAAGSGTLEAWIAPAEGLKYLSTRLTEFPFLFDWPYAKFRPTVFSCGDDFSSLFHYGLELRTTDQSLALETANNYYDDTVQPFPGGWTAAERWYHLAAVFSGGTVSYYVNGQQAGVQTALDPTPPLDPAFTGLFQIGAASPTADWGFPGKIDEVAIYNTALTPARIAAHFATAAMTFSVHSHDFIDPTNFAPLDVTLSAPTGQTSPEGLTLTFTYNTSIVTVTATLPDPYGSVTIPSGTAITLPVSGLSSVPLRVTPLTDGFGQTTLTVTPGLASGWIGDSLRITSRPLIVDGTYVNDHFDDGAISTNTAGAGRGWLVPYAQKGQPVEEGTSVKVLANAGSYAWTGIAGKRAAEFPFMNADGMRIEWTINYVQLTAAGSGGTPNASGAECWHELGVISANASHEAWNELYRNTSGGFYVNLFYSGYSSTPTENITVKGSIRVVNINHGEGSNDADPGIETPVIFQLANVTSITPAKPLVVTVELDQNGWKVGFSQDAAPVYSIYPTGASRPGVTFDSDTDKVLGGWGTDTLGEGKAGAAITTEFDNWAFLFAALHNNGSGNGQGWIDSAKACVDCWLSTDCPNPFADLDNDRDVDMDDFGFFQQCYTGSTGVIPEGCRCADHSGTGGIDSADFDAFLICAGLSGPAVPAPKTCDD